MKLERLEITGFGRLQQRRFDFGERVTVILGANESGKTTMHRAVRAALYGLEAGGPGHPRERSEWARWLPWAAGRYGVVLTYRLDSGQRFRVAVGPVVGCRTPQLAACARLHSPREVLHLRWRVERPSQ